MRNILIMLTMACLSISFFSCNEKDDKTEAISKTESTSKTEMKQAYKPSMDIFREKVVIFLSKEPDMDSNILDIQDFNENGKSFIPFFNSIESLKESTQNADLPFIEFEIDGLLFLSTMGGNETLRFNPTLRDDEYFQTSDLIEYYKADIEKLNAELRAKK